MRAFVPFSALLLCLSTPLFADSLFTPRAQLLADGQALFGDNCTGCHGNDGRGDPSFAPPLANSDFFMAIRLRPVSILLSGYEQLITVNGINYENSMPSRDFLTDYEIASILTYIRAGLNDSAVTSCLPYDPEDPETYDANGFAYCNKVPRDPGEIAVDSIGVWEVAAIRNPVRVNGSAIASRGASGTGSFRVTGAERRYVFALPMGAAAATLRVTDMWGRTVWSGNVRPEGKSRTVAWNGRASNGRLVSAGVYFARVTAIRQNVR